MWMSPYALVRSASTKTSRSFVFISVVRDAQDHRRDRHLLGLLAAGDSVALQELYDRHAGPLFRHALALTRQRSDAEDLVHVVFVKLATAGPPLLGVRQPSGYLHRMLHTAWMDAQRRAAAGSRVAADAQRDRPTWVQPGEMDLDLVRGLDALSDVQREVVVLHLVDGYSFREIGGMTGVSLFTAAGRYRDALGRLRAFLDVTENK
jgi:RNA polymerase sigma-70 factor (ECF subfamily)